MGIWFWYHFHMSEKIPNQEPTIDEQVHMAEELQRAVLDRNVIEDQYPGLDDLTVFMDSDPKNREEYERLWREYDQARKSFDEKVVNKLWLVKHLREIGKDDVATMIESMFGLQKLKY